MVVLESDFDVVTIDEDRQTFAPGMGVLRCCGAEWIGRGHG